MLKLSKCVQSSGLFLRLFSLIIVCRLDNLSAHIKKTHGVTWQVEPTAPGGTKLKISWCKIMWSFLSLGIEDNDFYWTQVSLVQSMDQVVSN